MILSPPIPWALVPNGAVVLHLGVPRTVLVAPGPHGGDGVWLEGSPIPWYVAPGTTVQLVLLDESDVVAALAAAGLNPEIIEE